MPNPCDRRDHDDPYCPKEGEIAAHAEQLRAGIERFITLAGTIGKIENAVSSIALTVNDLHRKLLMGNGEPAMVSQLSDLRARMSQLESDASDDDAEKRSARTQIRTAVFDILKILIAAAIGGGIGGSL